MKRKHLTYRFIIFLLMLAAGNILSPVCRAQAPIDIVKGNFEYLNKNVKYNKVFLNLDKPIYFGGDTIFFHGFVVEPFSGKLVKKPTISFVSLLDQSGATAYSEKLKVVDGIFSGYFVLDEFWNGNYTVVAHVESMRNYSPKFYFRKKVKIINSCREKQIEKKLILQVAAEGNQFMENQSNRLVAYIRDEKNRLVPKELILLENTDTLQRIEPDPSGLATFTLVPQSGKAYSIGVSTSQSFESFRLPKAIKPTVRFKTNLDPSNLLIQWSKNTSEERNKVFHLLIHQSTKLLYHKQLNLQDPSDSGELKVPKSLIPSGLVSVAVLDETGKQVYSRNMLTSGPNNWEVTTSQMETVFPPRSRIHTDVSIPTLPMDTLYYSISVVDKSLHEESLMTRNSIQRYLNVESELANDIFIPNTSDIDTLNQWLIFSGKTRIDWDNMAQTTEGNQKIYLNRYNLSANGTAKTRNSSMPIPTSTRINFYSAEHDALFEGFVQENGELDINLYFEFEDETTTLYNLSNSENLSANDIIVTIFEDHKPSKKEESDHSAYLIRKEIKLGTVEEMACSESLEKYYQRKTIGKHINRSYGFYESQDKSIRVSNTQSTAFFDSYAFESDLIRVLDEFILFDDMHQLTKEILHNLQIRTKKGQEIIRVYNRDIMHTFDGSPLFIIDGYPTFDKENYLTLTPTNLQSIEIISSFKNIARFGDFGKNGIVIVRSKKGKEIRLQNKNIVVFKGYQGATKRSFPDHGEQSLSADFRSVLFWSFISKSPSERSDPFYLSDDLSDFIILINGVTSSGHSFEFKKSLSSIVENQ